MRPMFSVEKVGIDAGGSALVVTARLPAWPPTFIPTPNAIAAVRRTAVIVRLFIIASDPPAADPTEVNLRSVVYTGVIAGLPDRTAATLRTARSAMAVRVSTVPLPT